ncbi:ROK family glucokinase [Terrilactibacillus laevilacticus]|uniref:Glucokinase n=1 Tax=Terrilactibacillus laevilacticus TaxID=1380157 RepID=A0ABW5PTR6_9BACI|nr:ROK family glucokinase [Terrilactibacillus laevilacticus]
MMDMWNVGVDIGGTTIKLAFVTDDGLFVDKWEIPTNTSENGKHIAKDISYSIHTKLKENGHTLDQVRGIGLGAPGFIEMSTGFIYQAVNIGWKDYALKEELENETGFPVIIDNDANIAAIGEMWLGAGKGSKDLLCVTLGTGVGGGVITGGEVVHGITGMAGEIGHVTVIPEGGSPCNCGKTGCLETVSSATGIRRLALEALNENPGLGLLQTMFEENGDISAADIFNCAKEKDALSMRIVETASYYLGFALANISMINNPEKIVIGGGVSRAGETLLEPVKRYFKQYALSRVSQATDIVIATLGNDAGILGAAWLAKNKL